MSECVCVCVWVCGCVGVCESTFVFHYDFFFQLIDLMFHNFEFSENE